MTSFTPQVIRRVENIQFDLENALLVLGHFVGESEREDNIAWLNEAIEAIAYAYQKLSLE